jgi:hypothetical protein
MPGRPRTSSDPYAKNRRTLGDAELSATPIKLPPANDRWLESTRKAWNVYAKSQAAQALRAEDFPFAVLCYEYQDRIAKALNSIDMAADPAEESKALVNVKSWQGMILQLANHLGIGPAARQRMGIKTNEKPGSRLQAFIAGNQAGNDAEDP